MSWRVPVRRILLGSLAAFLGCQAVDPWVGRPSLEVSTLFVDSSGHDAHRCLKELATSYLDYQEGVLFFEKTSKVKVKPPHRSKSEPYHVHVRHRVASGQVLDHLVCQDKSGEIEVDLSRFDDPECLVITSAAFHLKEEEMAGRVDADGPSAEGVIPAYTMSLKLVPSNQWEVYVNQDPSRLELETPWGVLHGFVQPFNRRDMYVSWLDAKKTLRTLIEQDPYVYLKQVDGYLPPRLTVDVVTDGLTWQRAGTWPMPEWIDRLEGDDSKKPFVFRTPGKELFSFGPPARLDLTMPKDPVTTAASIEARFIGVSPQETLKFVLACAYPIRGKADYGARVQTHDITARDCKGSYTATLEGLDPASFPLTAAITHRFLNPRVMQGGTYRPVPPRERIVLANLPPPGPRSMHSTVHLPRYASHYDFLAFFGDVGAKARYRSLSEAYHGRDDGGGGPTPNITPPPPTGTIGPPPTVPPAPPPPPPGGTTPGGPGGQGPRGGGGGFGGVAGGGGGGPQPPPGGGTPEILITLACPGKGGCGMVNCTCPRHTWTQSAVMNGVWNAFAATGPADISFFNAHGATAPCHKVTRVGAVRVTYWGVGFQLIHVWYYVSVTFQPCMGVNKPPPPPPPPPPGVLGDPPVSGGGSGSGGSAVAVVTGISVEGEDSTVDLTITGLTGGGPVRITGGKITTTPGTTIGLPYNSSGLMAQGAHVATVFGGSTLPIGAFSYSEQTLQRIASGFGHAYHGRPGINLGVSSVGFGTELSQSWGIYQPASVSSGGSGGAPPPPTCDPGDYYCTGQTKPIR